jgi:hypothetical protein
MEAWRQSQRIKRETVALMEMPIASFAALTANINRNSEKRSEPFTLNDFLIFKDHDNSDKGKLTTVTSAAMQDLRRRRLLPEFMLAAWPEVLKSAKPGVKPPECKALRSACENVWLINPSKEPGGIRCGLVGVHGVVRGRIKVQDPDRLMIWHEVVVPPRDAAGWIAHDLCLQVV